MFVGDIVRAYHTADGTISFSFSAPPTPVAIWPTTDWGMTGRRVWQFPSRIVVDVDRNLPR